MALPDFSTKAGLAILASYFTDVVNHLQGAAGKTDAWHLRASAGNNILFTLSDAAGAQKFSIRDSGEVEKFSVDSDGNVTVTGTFTQTGALVIPVAASPSQTTEGSVSWDTDDDRLTIGTGAATKVIGVSRGAGSDASATQELMYDTTAGGLKAWNGSASKGAVDTRWAIQRFIEDGVHKGMCALGLPPGNVTGISTGTYVGLGFRVIADGTSASVGPDTSTGMWLIQTGTTSAEDAGLMGPKATAASDWTFTGRCSIPSSADRTVIIGAKTTNDVFADENGLIAFRVSGTGNVTGVCDSAGSETTRDTSATGATEFTFRIEVRSGGTIVRFYKNDAQVGADVTTNIPSGNLIIGCGMVNSTTANKTMLVSDLAFWREV